MKKSMQDFCLGYLKDSLNVLNLKKQLIKKKQVGFMLRMLEGQFKCFKILIIIKKKVTSISVQDT